MRFRMLAARFALVGAAMIAATGAPSVVAAGDGDGELVAFLDGKPIPLGDVGRYYCDDFEYPVINCSKSVVVPTLRGTLAALVAGVDYVTIFDGAYYGGALMNLSQDYASLMTIGWNDKISSFKGRNSETGRFTTDWFFGGSTWSFCCNSMVPTLGTWNNTFSAVERT